MGASLIVFLFLSKLAFAGYNVTGDIYVTGNIGIGQATPPTKLYVSGNGYISGNLGIGIVTPTTKLYVSGTTTTSALNIGIGTASPTRLCIANNVVAVCP